MVILQLKKKQQQLRRNMEMQEPLKIDQLLDAPSCAFAEIIAEGISSFIH
jgi:hypothetical protein